MTRTPSFASPLPPLPVPVPPEAPAPVRRLRVAILLGGVLVEERLLEPRAEVSVGPAAGATFVLPPGAVRGRWTLFRVRGGRVVVHPPPGAEVRLASPAAAPIPTSSSGAPLPLPERGRGVVRIGEVTILFHLVAVLATPAVALPAGLRGGGVRAVDRLFAAVAVASLLLHGALVLHLRAVDWPRAPDPAALPDRFARFVRPAPAPAPRPAPAAPEVPRAAPADPDAATGPARAPGRGAGAPASRRPAPIDPAERRARLRAELASRGLLGALGALTGGGGSIPDLLGGGAVDRDAAEAFAGLSGVRQAKAYDAPGARGLLRAREGGGQIAASVAGLRGEGLAVRDATAVDVAAERRVRAVVRTEPPEVESGSVDPDAPRAIAAEVRRRVGALRACYERALRRAPALSGKIVLRFTITGVGTVSAVDVDDESLGSAEVVRCVAEAVRAWRFAARPGGPIELAFPFLFEASGS